MSWFWQNSHKNVSLPRPGCGVPSCQGLGCLDLILLVGCFYFFYKPGRHDLKEEAASGEYGGDSAVRSYTLHLIENSLALRGAKDPVGQARDAYDLIVRLVGERDLIEAGAKLQKARHDANGNLGEYIPIGECPLRLLSGVESLDAIFVFTYLLTSYDDRSYAVGAYLGNFYPQYAWMWREAERGFSALVQRYGEKAVLGAAKRVRAARKNSDGITITDSNGIEHWPYWWISTLAGDPNIQLPGQ